MNKVIRKSTGRCSGMSLVEVLVSVSILGVLSAIAIASISGTMGGSKGAVAKDLQGKLNIAVKAHSQANYEFNQAANNGAYTDEFAILRSLQWRDVSVPGSPFFRLDYNPVGSDSSEDYRLRWNGSTFVLLGMGTPGKGLKVDFSGSDQGTTFVFPSGYTPVPGI